MNHIRIVAAQCSQGVIIFDLSQRILWANQAALSLHEVSSFDELGRTIDEYQARFQIKYVALLEDVAAGTDMSDESMGSAQQPDVLVELKPKGEPGASHLLRQRKLVLFDDIGHPTCSVHFLQKQAALAGTDGHIRAPDARCLPPEQAGPHELSATSAISQARLESLAEAGVPVALYPAAIHILDDDMRIVDVSQRWLEWLGFARDAVIGRKIFDFMPAASAEHFERHTQQQFSGTGQVRDVASEFVTRSGALVHAIVSAQPAPGSSEQPNRAVSVCVDVTAQRRSEDSLAAVFATSTLPMLIRKCEDSRIIDANDAFLKATEFSVSGIIGHSLDEFTAFENRARKDQFEAAIRGSGQLGPAELGLKTAQGDMLDCVVTTTRIWAFGKPCVLLTLQDVSERRRTESELMSAIEAVMKDSSWFSRSVVERLAALRAPPKSGRRAASVSDLTPRERDVLSLISLGLPDAEIADRLGLTRSTIRNHLSTLYSKISVHNRGSAIIWARERCINFTQLPGGVQPKVGQGGSSTKQIMPLKQSRGWSHNVKSAAGD